MNKTASLTPLAPLRGFFPPLPQGYVARPRLCQRLAQGLSGRLLLVSAPAGFGKSCLAVEFAKTQLQSRACVWLGLDQRDQEPGRFFQRVFESFCQHYEGLSKEALVLLNQRQTHQPFDYEAWLSTWLDELALCAQQQKPLLLVLDDYHLACCPVLDRAIEFFLKHCPSGIVLLVTSRQQPDWHLARLRISAQVVELQEADLRLDQPEALALLVDQGVKVDQEQFQQLYQRSEGWVAGLRLWLLMGHSGQAELHGSHHMISSYLLEEVIGQQPPEVQQFLLVSAQFERFCAPLCDALREQCDSQLLLEHLKAHQVFLVPLDEQGRWFRYHHLFSDLLKFRAQQLGGCSVALHLRACRWFTEQGLLEEAVEHALRADQVETAASLVEQFSEEQLLAEQNVSRLLRWKAALPESLIASTPRLIMLYSWALLLACQLDAAQALAANLGHFFPAPNDGQEQSLRLSWLALNGAVARGRGQVERAEYLCSQALAGESGAYLGSRLLCLSTLANLAVVRGDVWRARGLNRDALELARRQDNPLFEAFCHYDRARLLAVRGEVFRAEDELRLGFEVLARLPQQQGYGLRVRLQIFQGFLQMQRLDTQAGVALVRESLIQGRDCRDVSVLLGYCILASHEGRQRRFTQAFAVLEEAERLMHVWDVPPIYYLAMVTLVKCELWLAQGQLSLAQTWLQRLYETYCVEPSAAAPEFHPLLPIQIELTYAQLQRRSAQPEAAQRRLQALLQRCRAQGALLMGAYVQTQLSMLLLRQGDSSQASELLRSSFAMAESGCLLPFTELAEHQPQWLHEHLSNLSPASWQACLEPLLPSASPATAEALSARELAVLRLIAQGCSNLQISERLFISLPTVKTHARHINTKLKVQRRTQAVAQAKALGLLE